MFAAVILFVALGGGAYWALSGRDAVLRGPCEVRALLNVPCGVVTGYAPVTLTGNCGKGARAVADDWTTDAVDTLENVVAAVRDKTVVPAQKATKAVVFGLLVAFFVLTAVLMLAIALFRVLVVLTGEVWAAYLILGGIFVVAGAFVWTLRSPRNRGRECLIPTSSSSSAPDRPG